MIVVGPNADGDLGEVSVEVTASANPLTVPPGVEHPAVRLSCPTKPSLQRKGGS